MEDEAMVKKKNIKGRAVLSPAMKMADLVNLNYHLLSVLSRLGVDLGFGEITVEEGATLDGIADLLKEEGLIRNEIAFKVQGILYESNIEPGKYILNTSMTTKELLEALNTEPEETVAAETQASDVIGGGDESVGEDQVVHQGHPQGRQGGPQPGKI